MGEVIREVIMEYHTNGDEQWALKRKEEVVRCRDCVFWDEKIFQCDRQICSICLENDFCSRAVRQMMSGKVESDEC